MNERPHRPLCAAAIALWLVLTGGVLACPYVVSLSDPGNFLIRNTVRIALLFWAAAMFIRLRHRDMRLLWSLACAAYLIHVAMAFEHYHHWSHASAVRHVQETSGFGPGILVSYLFTLLWTADVVWWWLAPTCHEQRLPLVNCAWHGFMIFVIVNGAIIYENGPIRWVGAVVMLGLLVMWLQSPRNSDLMGA
jgi:hypothetical protein